MLSEARDRRPEFVETLKRVINEIEGLPKQPAAMFIQLIYEDGTSIRFNNVQNGFNLLTAIGLLECSKSELILDVIRPGP
jgi:hypothetical protein